MMPFRILDVERQMQAIVNAVGEEISEAAYLTIEDGSAGDGETRQPAESGETVAAGSFPGAGQTSATGQLPGIGQTSAAGQNSVEGQTSVAGISARNISASDVLAEFRGGFVTTAAAYGYAESKIRIKAAQLPVENISLLGSELLLDGESVNLVVNYQMKLPFSVFGMAAVSRTNRCFLRAWIGSGGSPSDGQDSEAEDDPIVYVGKNSTRYHVSPSCHYLSNHLTAVPIGQIGNLRNTSGGRYTACARCGGREASVVYVMPSGDRYHTDTQCSAITAYVRAVRLSTVSHLGPCSYCSGG